MRIVLSPAAVYTARLATALVGCALSGAAFPPDPWYRPWWIGCDVVLFAFVAFHGLLERLGRLRRKEPGVIDSREILRSRDLWGTVAVFAPGVLLLRTSGAPLRNYLETMRWLLPFCLAMTGRRGYWDPIPPFVPTPYEERAVRS